MGFKRRIATTGKLTIPEGARKEAELIYLHKIVSDVEKHSIPSSLVVNLVQTPSKYVQAFRHAMAKERCLNCGNRWFRRYVFNDGDFCHISRWHFLTHAIDI